MKELLIKLFEETKKFLISNQAKTFYWTCANGFISLLALYLADMNLGWTPLAVALLNFITKSINKKIGNIQ